MSEVIKKNEEFIPHPVPQSISPKPIDTYSYTLGFTKGYNEGDSMIAGWAFGFCGVLAIIMAFIMLWNHVSRLTEVLERLQSGILEKLYKETTQSSESKKIVSFLLPFVLMASLAGCAGKQGNIGNMPPVPLPPQSTASTESSTPVATNTKAAEKNTATQVAEDEGQVITVTVPAKLGAAPHKGEPEELADLLEMKGGDSKDITAVSLMRPNALREAAQIVTFQSAMAYRYKQLLAETERHSRILDTAFDFSPLLMTQDDALILPPVLTRAGASMRIEDTKTATTAQTSYELLAPARYVSTVPNWRTFLMADSFPAPEKPNPAVMPKNDKERLIWRAAVREAWAQGLTEADQLYADNVSRLVREYRGIMLYHLLSAQHLLSQVNTASASLGMKTSDNGNKLHIGQKVYRITAPSAFTVPEEETPGTSSGKKSTPKNKRN